MRYRVGVDCDGVLADFLTPYLKTASRLLGREIKPEDLTEWDLNKLLPEEMYEQLWEEFSVPGVCGSLQPYPEAKEGMKALAEVADVYIVTAHPKSNPTWVHERDRWLADHFGVSRKKILYTAAKYVFSGNMLIDDKPENIVGWTEEYPAGIPVLWEHHYNKAYQFRDNISYKVLRTNDWDHIVSLLRRLSRG